MQVTLRAGAEQSESLSLQPDCQVISTGKSLSLEDVIRISKHNCETEQLCAVSSLESWFPALARKRWEGRSHKHHVLGGWIVPDISKVPVSVLVKRRPSPTGSEARRTQRIRCLWGRGSLYLV